MKTKSTVISENKDRQTLINAVISRIGTDSILDVINHGIDGGFNGFIYYKNTCAFYRRHRRAINQWVFEMADELGENAVDMVANFNCLKQTQRADIEELKQEIGRCIYDGKLGENTCNVENALAWFAAEEVCRLFDN